MNSRFGALVGGEAAGEADGQRVGIEGGAGRGHHLLGKTAAPPLRGDLAANEADQVRAQGAVGFPQLGVEHALDARPHLGIGQVVGPVGTDAAAVQLLHGRRQPGARVHAIRDVTDRHLVFAVVWPQHLPRPARDPAVQARHRVRVARHLEGEHGHAQRLARVLGPHAAQAQELLPRQPQRQAQRLEVLVDQLGRKAVVAGVDRRVRREHRGLRHVLRDVGERATGLDHAQACVLERGEGAVALVQVQAAPVDTAGAQRADAAHAEQQLLPDAHPLVTEVQARGQAAVLVGVAVDVGVEQQQLVAAHVDLPDLREQPLVGERHLDDERLAVGPRAQRRAQVLGGRADVFGVLLPLAVDVLAEIGFAVVEAHGDQGQAQVGGGLEVVAGQHAEATTVDGQRLVNAELRREVGDRTHPQRGGVGLGPGRRGRGNVGPEFPVGAIDPRAHGGVAGQLLQAFTVEAAHDGQGVVLRGAKAVAVDVAKQLDDGRVPRPPHVHGELVELMSQFLRGRHAGIECCTDGRGPIQGYNAGRSESWMNHVYSPSSWLAAKGNGSSP